LGGSSRAGNRSRIMDFNSGLQAEGGDGCLTEGESAVIGRDEAMGEDGEALLLESGAGEAE
jgi:hypothetical protein